MGKFLREKKIQELKIKNKRNLLCKHVNNGLGLDSQKFISIEDTERIKNMLYETMDIMDETQESIIIDNYYIKECENAIHYKGPESKDYYKKIIIDNISFLNNFSELELLFWAEESSEIGAIEILSKDIIKNIEQLLEISELNSEGYHFTIIDKEIKRGLAIFSSEYDSRLYKIMID